MDKRGFDWIYQPGKLPCSILSRLYFQIVEQASITGDTVMGSLHGAFSALRQVATMLFQQLVDKISPQQLCSKFVSKLVNKLWQCCSNNLSTRYLLNGLVANLLTSCDNAVSTTCQQDISSTGL